MNDLFDERLRLAARATRTPDAPPDLIARVIAERAEGRRAILPAEGASRQSRGRLVFGVAVAAAIAAGVILLAPHIVQYSPDATDDAFVSPLYAAQTSRTPSAPALSGVDGTRIHAGRYAYRVVYVDSSGRATPDGDGSIVLSLATTDGAPAWRVEHVAHSIVDGQRRTEAETLLVSRRELRPITRVVHVQPYRRYSVINIDQRFVGDSVLGTMTTDGGVRRPIAHRLPSAFGPYLSDGLAPLGLAGVPLSSSWRGSLSVIGWAVVPRDVFYPATLEVVGDERITTPLGTFDCWKLNIVAGSEHRIEWVRKSDGVGVRSLDTAGTPRGHRQFELTEEPNR